MSIVHTYRPMITTPIRLSGTMAPRVRTAHTKGHQRSLRDTSCPPYGLQGSSKGYDNYWDVLVSLAAETYSNPCYVRFPSSEPFLLNIEEHVMCSRCASILKTWTPFANAPPCSLRAPRFSKYSPAQSCEVLVSPSCYHSISLCSSFKSKDALQGGS